MYCWNCGEKLEDGASFCTNCGADQRTVPVDAAQTGEPGVAGSRPSATMPMPAQPIPASRATGQAKAKGPNPAVIVAVVVAAVAVLAGGVFLFTQMNRPSASTDTSQTSSAVDTGSSDEDKSDDAGSSSSPAPSSPKTETALEKARAHVSTDADSVVYSDPDYGFAFTMGPGYELVSASETDGVTFEDPSSQVSIRLWGAANTTGATSDSELSSYLSSYNVEYKAKESDWCVASWKDSTSEYYVKEFVGSGYINGIEYSYPLSALETGSSAIEATVRSFTPGTL